MTSADGVDLRALFPGASAAFLAANGVNTAPAPPKQRVKTAADMAVSEADFQAQVVEYAALHGWRTWHVRDSRAQAMTDFPDLVLVRDRVLFRELKRVGGRATPGQKRALDQLRRAGADAELWCPTDWDLIVETLR